MRGRVEISGINTAKLPVLKIDEMTALLRRAHAGDTAAREQLICSNLRLVLSVLQRFAGRGESADDLFQVGCIGLMKAIDNFDVEQPVRFSTYGVPMIYGRRKKYFSKVLKICRNTNKRASCEARLLQEIEILTAPLTSIFFFDTLLVLIESRERKENLDASIVMNNNLINTITNESLPFHRC